MTPQFGRVGRAVVSIVSVVTLKTACSNAPTSIDLTGSSNGQTVVATVGDNLRISLGTVGPGKYDSLPAVSGPALVFLNSGVVPPYTPGGAHQRFEFIAAAAGQVHVTIGWSQDGVTTDPSRAFELDVTVR